VHFSLQQHGNLFAQSSRIRCGYAGGEAFEQLYLGLLKPPELSSIHCQSSQQRLLHLPLP
jgi:hypothetical protein